RHTSSKRDWSSDVCSSDLLEPKSEILQVVLNINGVYGCINKAYILKVYLQSFIYLREIITTSKVLHGFGRAGYFFKLYIHLKSIKHLVIMIAINDTLTMYRNDWIR